MRGQEQNRTLNRRKWQDDELRSVLASRTGIEARVFALYKTWLQRRRGHPAFHPDAAQIVRDLGPKLFAFIRIAAGEEERIACVFNFTARPQTIALADLDATLKGAQSARDLLSGQRLEADAKGRIQLEPYYAYWLTV